MNIEVTGKLASTSLGIHQETKSTSQIFCLWELTQENILTWVQCIRWATQSKFFSHQVADRAMYKRQSNLKQYVYSPF